MVSRKDGRRQKAAANSEPSGGLGAPLPDQFPSPHERVRPGWPSPMPDRLQWMLPHLEQKAFNRAEVYSFWQKALAKANDATLPGLSVDSALEAAYSAGRLGCVAVLAGRHIRVRARTGHHEMTFAAVAALELPGCSDLSADSEEVRGMRIAADYHSTPATLEEREHAIAWMQRTLPVLRAALVAGDPALAPYIA